MTGHIVKGLSTGLQAAVLLLLFFVWSEPRCLYAEGGSLSHTGKLPQTNRPALSWGRDIFVPLVKDAVGVPQMRLKAVFFSGKRPSAIINDKIVYKGSLLEGQKVIAIGKSHVILQGKSGTIRLELDTIPELSHDAN
jgi:hypothetical protein